MTERILKYGGIDPLSRTESPKGDAEPDNDPRGKRGTEIVRGMHLMSAVEQLEPCATTEMAYFDPDGGAEGMNLDEIEQAVRDGDMSLEAVMTKTGRFTPLVNPRRSRLKRRGDLSEDGDADLWYVPTNNYTAMPPRQIFEPLARAIDQNDSVENGGVFGEFRERRNGGEVFGNIWFSDFDVGAIEGDPVRLGFEVGWNYFGGRRFFRRPWAQQTRCRNSVAPLDDRVVVQHNRNSVNWREWWDEALEELGIYGDRLTQAIQAARSILFDFSGELVDEDTVGGDTVDEGTGDEVAPMPMGVDNFYRHLDFPDPTSMADHAREEARNSGDPRERADRVNAWHLHAGATYWLSWHWSGSEDSRAFRGYRRTANDMLWNPHQIATTVRDSYGDEERRRVVADVLGPDRELSDATDEERDEIEERLGSHEGIATVNNSVESLEDAVEQFRDTEERLDRIQEAMAG